MKFIRGKVTEIYPGIRVHPVTIIPEESDKTAILPPVYEDFVTYVKQKRIELREKSGSGNTENSARGR